VQLRRHVMLSPCADWSRFEAFRPAAATREDVGAGLRIRNQDAVFSVLYLPFVVVRATHAAIRHRTSNMAVVKPLNLHSVSQAGRNALDCRPVTPGFFPTLAHTRLLRLGTTFHWKCFHNERICRIHWWIGVRSRRWAVWSVSEGKHRWAGCVGISLSGHSATRLGGFASRPTASVIIESLAYGSRDSNRSALNVWTAW
jgi:hypothetical protein